jgi:Uma2 family endonuclease
MAAALIAPVRTDSALMTVAEFRAFCDAHPTEKWQLVEGRLYAMAGGTIDHATLKSNLEAALRSRLKGRCMVWSSDVNVVREENRFSSFSDVVVRCGGPPLSGKGREVTDPTACFEILSPSTKHLDRGDKLFAYQQTPSLQYAALISPDEIRIETWSRVEGGFEEQVVKRREDALIIAPLGVEIPLAEIYEGVEVEE